MCAQEIVRVGRIMVATDRSESADYAVAWAAAMAERFAAELWLLQVIVPQNPAGTQAGQAEATRASYAADDLMRFSEELAGERGRAKVVVGEDPADAIVEAAEAEEVDVLVVGNLGMSGRKEFLLGNVPNRVSHNARCTVVIVNSSERPDESGGSRLGRLFRRDG
jgi:nucleotide-binding universal stress UspA family protein